MIQFMNTNVLAFDCVCSTVNIKYKYDINSTFVLRRAQEKILYKLIDKDGKTSYANIEYNQLD